MTLKLVTDNGEPMVELGPVIDFSGLDTSEATSVVTITLGEGGTVIRVLGEQLSAFTLMGIFEAAKFEMLSDMMFDD